MNISDLYEVAPLVDEATIKAIARLVARDILKSVRWYDIDVDDIYREDSIKYIRTRITWDYLE